MLRAHDLLVLFRLALSDESWTYASLADELGMNVSDVHGAVRRAEKSGLIGASSSEAPRTGGRPRAQLKVNRSALLELTLHGLRYVYPAEHGPITRGTATSHSAAPLNALLAGADQAPLVWPDPEGTLRGESIEPLGKSAPAAARRNPALHEVLALVDALRVGRARERKLAAELLRERLA